MAEPRSGERQRTDVERKVPTERDRERSTNVARTKSRDVSRTRTDPFSMMNRLRREFDQVFDNLGLGLWTPTAMRPSAIADFAPQVEVYERDGKLHVNADLPGMNKDDVKVEVSDNILTLEGERKSERSDEEGGWTERSYGRFYRSIPLPEGLDPDSAEASFDNGVLEITFDAPPEQETSRTRKIDIR